MNLKISFILTLLLLSPIICNAKTIEINSNIYEVEDTLETDSFSYDAKNNTLILNNASLKTIRTGSDLKIILIGENYLENNLKTINCIDVGNLKIVGDGKLNILSKKGGIVGTSIYIENSNIMINSSSNAFSSSSENNLDMIINNSNIEIISSTNAFNIVDTAKLIPFTLPLFKNKNKKIK